MQEQRVMQLLLSNLRSVVNVSDRRIEDAMRRAARLIASEAAQNQRQAASTASQIGAMITRGRTRI